jgi:hypothetical protein
VAQRRVAGLLQGVRRVGSVVWCPFAGLLQCIKFDIQSVRSNPDAKKYQSAVSFLVVRGAFEG